jgi:sirohydrochlorin ferrochelatase
MKSAVILIAHGSRRAEANRDLVTLAEMLRPHLSGELIEIAYLEMTEPTIPQALDRALAAGATSIRMFPFFLSAGAHVTEDLERFRGAYAEQNPAIQFRLCPPIGLHPKIVEIILDRLA